jgi:nitrogen fixation/metabolism regulation signal transduction histidine kinase
MVNPLSKEKSGFKPYIFISLTLIFIILLTYTVNIYFHKTIEKNWDSISLEKTTQIKDDCLGIFNNYQNQVSQFSTDVLKNKKLTAAISAQNTRKAYEYLLETENLQGYNVEIYNSRLELFLFMGRQLNPDVLDLKRALSGEKFSSVKEIGFYSYIVVYEPIHIDSLTSSNKTISSNWILVSAKLLDNKYEIQNKFFSDIGITREISKKYHIDVNFDFSRFASSPFNTDSSQTKDKLQFDIKNIRQEVIGKLYIPQLEKSSYILNVENKFSIVLALEIFILNIFLGALAIVFFIRRVNSLSVKTASFAFILIVSRYIWLVFDFPSRLFGELGIEMFSPAYYASSFAFGIGKSIGDLLISSIIFLAIVIYVTGLSVIFFKRDLNKNKTWPVLLIIPANVAAGFLAIYYYGALIQSIIYDSNLKFIDRSQIINTQQPELIYANLSLLLLSIALILILTVCGLIITKIIQPYLLKKTFARRYSVFIVFTVLILLNLLYESFSGILGDLSVKFNFRLLIYALSAAFTYYVYRQLLVVRKYRFVNLLNLSLVLLACVIFVPALLLNKISSQENRYLERFAKEISEQSDDKINFIISSRLDDVSDNPSLGEDIKNKNKYPRLAFNIWTQSKLYNEDINSAVFVLDTAKKLISDFNINPSELLADSVIKFSLRSISSPPKVISQNEDLRDSSQNSIEPGVGFTSDLSDEGDFEEVLQNKEMKFYCGIRPIEKIDLKNSKFNKILGYVIIACQYDAKSYITNTGESIFRNFSRDNITNKLTSQPVISEFSDGDIVGSSNKEISKAFIKSLDAFRESVKDKKEKNALRYDEFENELYKSFYFTPPAHGGSSPEKIYVVSVKANDFALYSFYSLRYLLFVVVIFAVFFVCFVIYRAVVYLIRREGSYSFRFRFREKLFVSFVLASVIPIVVLAIYTRELAKEKNNDFYKNQLISDLRIMEQYIRTKAPFLEFPKPPKEGKQDNLSDIFGRGFSQSEKNFNLFVKTKLAATTNEELYKSDLLDTRISGNAFYNVAVLKKDYYSESEEIGNYKFIVGYKPLYDRFNNLAGIISSQTVFKQSEINEELTESLVYIFGPYFIAVILLIVIVNIIAYRISNPIVKLQKATEQLSKGNIDIQVQSNSSDEIGELINSFNKMTRELKRSREELKKAERESAWRDIARQIAHEIKNPLTPMKLAIQHMYYAYTHGANDFKTIIQTTNRLIIEQIESLNRIATEFSDFAKMPSRNYEPLNVESILKDVVELVNRDGKINLTLKNPIGNARVTGDKDEVKRVFMNIIRNSTQAIDEKTLNRKDGIVNVTGLKSNGFYTVTVKDDGIGMDEATLQMLFEPYFSTKSSGMGLGLVITKKILDDMQAKINVKSEVDKGTEVEIRFKIE